MSERGFGAEDSLVNVATLTSDDALLDALGRGEDAPVDDEMAALLAAWRDDLAVDLPTELRPALPPRNEPDDDTAVIIPITRARRRRFNRLSRITVSAAAGLAILGGFVVAAGNAGPDSPLWPITRVVYQRRADSREAERAAERVIAQARQAAVDGRYADANRLLDSAEGLIAKVHDPAAQKRLTDEVAEIRRLIAAGPGAEVPGAPGAATTPAVTPAPGAPGETSPGGQPGGGQPGGGGPTGGVGPVPGLPLPTLPLPTLPLPGLPLPTTPKLPLPTLPLPTLPLLPSHPLPL